MDLHTTILIGKVDGTFSRRGSSGSAAQLLPALRVSPEQVQGFLALKCQDSSVFSQEPLLHELVSGPSLSSCPWDGSTGEA